MSEKVPPPHAKDDASEANTKPPVAPAAAGEETRHETKRLNIAEIEALIKSERAKRDGVEERKAVEARKQRPDTIPAGPPEDEPGADAKKS